MERLTLSDGKVFIGKRIFEKQGESCKIYIYLTKGTTEKYFVLRQDEASLKAFYITGKNKIEQVLEVLDGNISRLNAKIENEVRQIEKQCTTKSLKRLDAQKFKDALSKYYDKNYSKFVVLGREFDEFINQAK